MFKKPEGWKEAEKIETKWGDIQIIRSKLEDEILSIIEHGKSVGVTNKHIIAENIVYILERDWSLDIEKLEFTRRHGCGPC